MKSLTAQSAYLIFALFLNYLFALLSPVLLVRVFDVDTYGRYREFMLYAMMLINFMTFSIPSNLQYFLPLEPQKSRQVVTNTSLMMFLSTAVGIILIWLFRDTIFSKTSYDFVSYLIVYILFYLGLNFFENYCIATAKTNYLPIYSSSLVIFRVSTAVLIAIFTNNLFKVFAGLIFVEILKFGFLLFFFIKERLLAIVLDVRLLRHQIKFIYPLGVSGIIIYLSQNLSKFFISLYMGVSALAVYSIGSYNIPIIAIVRGGIYDIIFPEMVRRQQSTGENQLVLWQQANIVLYFIVLPLAIVLFFCADAFVQLLFTAKYAESVNIFRIYLVFMLRQTFEMGTPLKAKSKNSYFVVGQSLSLAINLLLIWMLFKPFGILGPAFAFIISDIVLSGLLGYFICTTYKIRISEVFMWNKILKISLLSLGLMPILIVSFVSFEHYSIISMGASFAYLTCYFCLGRKLDIEEINVIYAKASSIRRWYRFS